MKQPTSSRVPLPERLREVDQFVEQHPEHELRTAEPDRSLLPNEQ